MYSGIKIPVFGKVIFRLRYRLFCRPGVGKRLSQGILGVLKTLDLLKQS